MSVTRIVSLRPLAMSASAAILALGGLFFAPSAEAGDRHQGWRGHGYHTPHGHYRDHGRSHGYHHRYQHKPRFNVSYRSAPPVYYSPRPVYYAPAPVYYAPRPVYYAPAPAYYAPSPYYGGGSYSSISYSWR